MAKPRVPIPQDVADDLFVANGRCCCMCQKRRQLQIHHIDENPANNDPKNLAALCLGCHGRVSGDEGLGRRITASEIRKHKIAWEAAIARRRGEADDDEDEEDDDVVVTDRKRIVVRAEETWSVEYPLEENHILVADVEATRAVTIGLARKSEFKKAMKDQTFRGELHQDVFETRISLAARAASTFVFWVEGGDKDTKVTLEIAIVRDSDSSEEGDEEAQDDDYL